MPKKSRKNLNILRAKIVFKMKEKAFFIIFEANVKIFFWKVDSDFKEISQR